LHELLTDVYGEERRISTVLQNFGLPSNAVDKLKNDNLSDFCENIQFALSCRFLHYSGGHRLLSILMRRYGLFDTPKETLEAIGDSMNITRERVRQLEGKAIKRLIGGVSADSTGILITLAACKTLGINAMDLLRPLENESNDINSDNDNENTAYLPNIPVDMPHADFYVQSSFDYSIRRGGYLLLMKFGSHTSFFDEQNIEGHSDVSMILLAVINGLEKLKKPCFVTVHSNTIFGISSIYNKKGVLRESVPEKAANYELKEHIRQLLCENGHILKNIAESNIREQIAKLQKENQ
jgi:ribonuclease HI